ncbi:hypothetical protein WAI453_011850 [Rhynchosporium graminicola]
MEMAPEVLTFMPNGDVTLTLIRHVYQEVGASVSNNKSSAVVEEPVLDEDAEIEAALGIEPEDLAEDEEILFYAPDAPGSENGPSYPPPPRANRDSDPRDRSASPPASFWAALKRQAAKINVERAVEESEPKPAVNAVKVLVSSHEVHCIVSSRHLILASRYFETVLSGDFEEAKALRATGHVEIPMLDEDLESMTILLTIIHGASRKVPRNVSLELLSNLAVLVSKFGMLETVEFFSDTWIDHLQREGLPQAYTKDVLRLLFVFWVFDRETEFRDMTRLAQREADDKFEEDVANTEGIMIPLGIVDAIKQARLSAIETALAAIHALIDKYMEGSSLCDAALDEELRYACDAMVLGSLLKSSRKIGIWPKPASPFPGRKYRGLAKAIRGIKILDVCSKTNCRKWNSHGPAGNSHGLEDVIEEKLKEVEESLDGLRLFDFAKKSEEYIPVLRPPPPPPVINIPVNGDPKKGTHGIKKHSQAYGERVAVVKPMQNGELIPEELRAPVGPSQSRPSPTTSNSKEGKQSVQEQHRFEIPRSLRSSPDHQPQQHGNKPELQREQPSPRIEPMQRRSPPSVVERQGGPKVDDRVRMPNQHEIRSETQQRQTSQRVEPTRGRSPPSPVEQRSQSEIRTTERRPSPSLFDWPSQNLGCEPEQEVKAIPRSQQSSGFTRQEIQAQYSPRDSMQDLSIGKPMSVSKVQKRQNSNGVVQQEVETQSILRNGYHENSVKQTPLATAQQRQPQHGHGQRDTYAQSSARNSVHEIIVSTPMSVSSSQQKENGQYGHDKTEQNGHISQNGRHDQEVRNDLDRQNGPTTLNGAPSRNQANGRSEENRQNGHSSGPKEQNAHIGRLESDRINEQNERIEQNGQHEFVTALTTMSNRKPISNPSTPTSPTFREEATAPSSRDVSKVAAQDKRLTRTPSYKKLPVGREDVKSPPPEEPRIASMNHDAMMEGVLSSNRNGSGHPAVASSQDERLTNIPAPVATMRKVPSPPAPTPVPAPAAVAVQPIKNRGRDRKEKSPPTGVFVGRESPLKQVQLAGEQEEEMDNKDNEMVIEENVWMPPAQNFRTRNGKKAFSTRFS